ncbi:MAG: hypothetical protein U0556_13420 [Dehalococcoidia bacterium]
MNTLHGLQATCDTLGLRFETTAESLILQFGTVDDPIPLVVSPFDLVVSVVRPCGAVRADAITAAAVLANRLNVAGSLIGSFWIREHDLLLAYEVTIVAPEGVTAIQLDVALAAAALNPNPAHFATLLR